DFDADRLAAFLFGKGEMEDTIGEAGFDSVAADAFGAAHDPFRTRRAGGFPLALLDRFMSDAQQAFLGVEAQVLPLPPRQFDAGVVMSVVFEPLRSGIHGGSRRGQKRGESPEGILEESIPFA